MKVTAELSLKNRLRALFPVPGVKLPLEHIKTQTQRTEHYIAHAVCNLKNPRYCGKGIEMILIRIKDESGVYYERKQ
jgi:hypothetical protein